MRKRFKLAVYALFGPFYSIIVFTKEPFEGEEITVGGMTATFSKTVVSPQEETK